MSKPEPRFSVGERVIVRATGHSYINANDVVVVELDYKACLTVNNDLYHGWAYRTDHLTEDQWLAEECLFPRPKPATESFYELMSAVKNIGATA